MKSILTFCCSLICFNHGLFAQNFTEVPSPFEQLGFSSITIADLNNDMSPDVLITGLSLPPAITSKLYTNDGQGNFTEMPSLFEGAAIGSVSIGDINGDMTPDVLITGFMNTSNDQISKLYTNDGQGTFTEVSSPFEAVANSSTLITDLNNDGNPDVLISGRNASLAPITKLYTNDGQGTFTEVPSPFEAVYNSSVAIADLNNDGNPDLLISGLNGSNTPVAKLYTSDGQGTFTEMPSPFEGAELGSITIADVNGDLSPDVLISGRDALDTPIAKLYTNDGQGTFTEVSSPFEGVYNSSVAIADLNNDGNPDVLISGRDSSFTPITKLYTNDGQGSFTEVPSPFEQLNSGSIAIADVNGDLSPDVLISGLNVSSLPVTKLYLNEESTSVNSLNNNSHINYTLSPNPVTDGVVNIQINIKQSSRVRIHLYDVIGQRLVQQEAQLISGEHNVLLDVSKLEKGTYFVALENGQGYGVQKLTIL